MEILLFVFIAIFAFFVLGLVFGSFFTVQQQSRAIIERFGKYVRTATPGLNFKVPYIEGIVQRVSLRVQQLPVEVETKTLDNVFVKVFVAVQYRVVEGSEADSYYKLQDHVEQIKSYVLDVVRAKVPKMTLDEVFEKKDDVGAAVKSELDVSMKQYGYEIPNALVTDVNPADNVKAAMNEIQTQQRLQIAAAAKGEANKILVVKNAEAEAESKHLQGEGIAKQRRAIIDGLRESIAAFTDKVGGVNEHEVLNLVLLTQYFDTMKDIGISSGSKVILVPHSPSGMNDVIEQIRNAIITGNEATPKILMATYADLKRLGLALPGVELFHLMQQPALRANRKIFALWWPPDCTTILKLQREHQVMLFDVRPNVFAPCKVGVGGVWSYVEIAKLDRAELKALVTEAWAQVMPKKASRALLSR